MADLSSHLESYYHASIQRMGKPEDVVQKFTDAVAADPVLMDAARSKKAQLESLESSMPHPSNLAERDFVGFIQLQCLRAVLGR